MIPRIDILGLGVCTLDLLMRVDEFPGEEEAIQRTDESALQGGGPVPTALAAATKLGASTAMIDRLGDDWRGDLIFRELLTLGVDTRYLSRETAATSCIASVWVRRSDGARSIAFSAGSAQEFTTLAELPEFALKNCRILHTNGRHWEINASAALLAKSGGAMISFDGGAQRFREEMRDFIPHVDIAIVARDWAEKFAGTKDLEAAAAHLRETGPSWTVITDGLAGSWIYPPDELPFHQPAFQLPPGSTVDTTGCGDVYHGAFLTGITQDWPATKCARIASAVAALNATAMGGRGKLSNLEAAEEFAHTYQPVSL